MSDNKKKRVQAIKLNRRFQFQVLAFFVILISTAMICMSAVIYIVTDQELGKSFFSAHRSLYNIWQDLLPAVIGITACITVLVSVIGFIGLFRFKRSLEKSGRELLEFIDDISKGNLKSNPDPDAAGHLKPIASTTMKSFESFRLHLQEAKDISIELNRGIMRLNYMVFEEGEVTLGALKSISSNLNELSKSLSNSLKWFEI